MRLTIRNSIYLITLLLLMVFASAACAQNTQPPTKGCSSLESRQFDFWTGEWDATWPGAKAGEVQHGKNTIQKILDGCVIREQFDGGDASPLRGLSVSAYSPRLQKWQQTWVDNQGAYLDFVGEFKEGQMVLSRHARNPKGDEIVQRMVYKNITPDSFDWSWEQSSDGGGAWSVIWPIHYVRRKP
jgi:Protein of unknown function (DUF1579)